MRRDLGAALVAAVAVVAFSSAAKGAMDTLVRLEYQADEPRGCVAEGKLRSMVTDHLRHDPFRPDADRKVAIDIAKTDAGFQGRIVWTQSDGRQLGERLLSSRSRDCHEIAANVAFAVALQLQLIDRGEPPDAGAPVPSTQRPASTVAEESNRTSPARPERPSLSATAPGEAPAVPARPEPSRPVLAVGAGPALGMGMSPGATALGRLFVDARFRRFSAEIAADSALPVTQREPDGSGAVVSVMGSSAAGCGHLSIIAACALGRIGWIRARGTGVDAPSTSWARFNQVGIRVAGTKDFGRFIVRLHADGLVMLSRWNVVLNDTAIWSVPRVGVLAGLDVALRFF